MKQKTYRGVTYFEDLEETKAYIVNEICFAEKEKNEREG